VKNRPSGKGKEEKQGVLRPVANGYLMAVVQPAAFSKAFHAGTAVTAKAAAEVRLGPGSQYGVAGKVDAGVAGKILAHKLDGVKAKGDNWWHVQFDGTEGWLPETSLSAR
jgi:uncharacterized protein YgiM (DUF1202 family)